MLIYCTVVVALLGNIVLALSEDERVEIFKAKHSWPPKRHSESSKYQAFAEEREREIMALPGGNERWENWMQFTQSRIVPKFTETGFALVKTPPHLFEELLHVVEEGVANWDSLEEEEGVGDAIYNRLGLNPKMVPRTPLWNRVHEELLPLHEQWAGVKLFPTSIYGIRLYQNTSSLVMHCDKVHSHVISSIIHIAHQYDDDDVPWPIEIEDHDGVLHAVALQPGDMLFYESARCLHGRMTEFRGKYYGSIFAHYQPVDANLWPFTVDDVIQSVPPHWNEGLVERHGSRWAGQAITIDSRVVANAPPRIVQGSNEAEDEGAVDDAGGAERVADFDDEIQAEMRGNEVTRLARLRQLEQAGGGEDL